MINKKTVFVLGAGASWHYGYPTGEGLVEGIINLARAFRTHCENRLKANYNLGTMPTLMQPFTGDIRQHWRSQIDQIDDLINRLENVQPVVIDYFLGWNKPLAKLGRTLIAATLMEREARGAGSNNINHLNPAEMKKQKDNWARFVVHQLLMGCEESVDLLRNNVHFITFNYDTSFEAALKRALLAINFLDPADIDKFFAYPRVIHMYGALAHTSVPDHGAFQALYSDYAVAGVEVVNQTTSLISNWAAAAANILVIDPHDKDAGTASADAKKLLDTAERVYFFGFAFDDNNVTRLGFPLKRVQGQRREFFFTNWQNSGTVNKKAAKALTLPNLRFPETMEFADGNWIAEKSVRDTYRAIELDFGGLSE